MASASSFKSSSGKDSKDAIVPEIKTVQRQGKQVIQNDNDEELQASTNALFKKIMMA